MSNTRGLPIGKPVVPAGDMGIGLCLACLGEIIANGDQAPPPRFGITFAPMPQTLMTPAGPIMAVVAVPACWEHLRGASGQPEQKRPLLVANGALPR